jgi:hypothetical protein
MNSLSNVKTIIQRIINITVVIKAFFILFFLIIFIIINIINTAIDIILNMKNISPLINKILCIICFAPFFNFNASANLLLGLLVFKLILVVLMKLMKM